MFTNVCMYVPINVRYELIHENPKSEYNADVQCECAKKTNRRRYGRQLDGTELNFPLAVRITYARCSNFHLPKRYEAASETSRWCHHRDCMRVSRIPFLIRAINEHNDKRKTQTWRLEGLEWRGEHLIIVHIWVNSIPEVLCRRSRHCRLPFEWGAPCTER